MSTKVIKGLLLAVALVAVVVAFVRFNQVTLSDGPVPVVWDREVCAHCKMHVGDPRFASQLQTTEGDVLNFDDPGCLLDYLQSHEISVHGLYFRNHVEDGWLSESEVGFLPVEDSPMGYGIRALSKDTPEAQGIDWAKARVMERPHHQPRGP
jgi:copper chaperone NosL